MDKITLEELLFYYVKIADYYRGFGDYQDDECIIMQVFAELIYNKEEQDK